MVQKQSLVRKLRTGILGDKCEKAKYCVLCNKECGHIALQLQCPTRKIHSKNKSMKLQGQQRPTSNKDRSRSRSNNRAAAAQSRQTRSVSNNGRNQSHRTRSRSQQDKKVSFAARQMEHADKVIKQRNKIKAKSHKETPQSQKLG